jgi:hypothetical protein
MRRTSLIPVFTAALAVTVGLLLPSGSASAAGAAPAARTSGAVAAAAVAPTVTGALTIKPRYTTKPKAPYRKGQRIKVKFAGFPANLTMLIAVCRAGTDLSRGGEAIGDCAPFAGPSSEFSRTGATGAGSGKVTILKGKLNATNWPGYRCGNTKKTKCVLVVSDLSAKYVAKKVIKYQT